MGNACRPPEEAQGLTKEELFKIRQKHNTEKARRQYYLNMDPKAAEKVLKNQKFEPQDNQQLMDLDAALVNEYRLRKKKLSHPNYDLTAK